MYRGLSLLFFCIALLAVLDKLGKGLVLRESIVLFYSFTCLLMPLIGYKYYSRDNHLAFIFGKVMAVPEVTYFSFVLPAIAAFAVAICWPLPQKSQIDDNGPKLFEAVDDIKNSETDIKQLGLKIMVGGIMLFLLFKILPAGLRFVGVLFFFSTFAGFLYVYYSPASVSRLTILLVFSLFIFGNALASGMFTIVAYMGITLFSYFFLGNKVSLLKKASIFIVAILFFLVLQNTKGTYRQYTWHSNYKGNKAALFIRLYIDNLKTGEGLFDRDEFFPVYTRTNQGLNISLVQKRIPARQQFDNGDRLLKVLAASIVPRVFWPDKPEAGGKFNMLHYAGIRISGFSTNVGPLGEGWGSFGRDGGIVFMFVLGWFIRLAYLTMFNASRKAPFLIFWIPVVFYQLTYSAETDTLQILNSIFKGGFFIWLFMKVKPDWFGQLRGGSQRLKRYETVSNFPEAGQ